MGTRLWIDNLRLRFFYTEDTEGEREVQRLVKIDRHEKDGGE